MVKKTEGTEVPKPGEKKEAVVKETFAVGEIPTATKAMVVDTKTEEVYTIPAALARIMNDIEQLKVAMLGKTT